MPEIHFILVEPAVPENIGSAARAVKTMGFSELCLVDPKGYPDKKAEIIAHGANEILDNARIVQSLAEAIENMDFVIGTTAKNRAVHHDYYTAGETVGIIRDKGSTIKNIAFVFGREESGLSNSELQLCQLVSYLPARVSYPSLNLAQAVMLYAYVLSEGLAAIQEPEYVDLCLSEHKILLERASALLQHLGFDPGSNIYKRFMERIAVAGQDDVHLMLSFLNKMNNA